MCIRDIPCIREWPGTQIRKKDLRLEFSWRWCRREREWCRCTRLLRVVLAPATPPLSPPSPGSLPSSSRGPTRYCCSVCPFMCSLYLFWLLYCFELLYLFYCICVTAFSMASCCSVCPWRVPSFCSSSGAAFYFGFDVFLMDFLTFLLDHAFISLYLLVLSRFHFLIPSCFITLSFFYIFWFY